MIHQKLSLLPLPLWLLLGLIALGLFFASVGLVCLCVIHRRKRLLIPALVLLPVGYMLTQAFFGLQTDPAARGRIHAVVQELFLAIPPWVLIPVMLGLPVVTALLWRMILRDRQNHIAPTSVKEAVDKLPVGLCCYLPGGRIVLANTAMERLCQTVTGKPLYSGEVLQRALTEQPPVPGCRLADAGDTKVLLLPDGEARALSFQQISWEGETLTAILAPEVTEAWGMTKALEERKEALSALNRRLAGYNREIVDLTIQSEILAARVRLHDTLGENLLTMRQILHRGVEETDLEKLRQRMLRSISFLKDDRENQAEDEFSVLLHSADDLGVRIETEGSPPEDEALRKVVATGLHECLTNLLRHAHGDLLRVALRWQSEGLIVIYSGNGDPPKGPIRETGGLRILRTMTEQLGGTMELSADPTLRVTLTFPKEVPNAL